jgi:hypothetical protein
LTLMHVGTFHSEPIVVSLLPSTITRGLWTLADTPVGKSRARNVKAPAKTAAAKQAPAKRAAATTRGPAKKAATAKAAPAKAASSKGRMSVEHKAALATGREEGRAVRAYLDAIDRPRRPGRRRTTDSVSRQIEKIDGRLATASPSERLHLIQQRFDLKQDLDRLKMEAEVDLKALENAFVKVASVYSERKGISYTAWRAVGVPADALRRAGISRAKKK